MKQSHTIRYSVDLAHLPEMGEEQRQRLEKLQALPEDQIDTSDLPERLDRQWTLPGALVPSTNKQQLTLRLDADVLAFFRGTGKRYQSRINAVLREYMQHQQRHNR